MDKILSAPYRPECSIDKKSKLSTDRGLERAAGISGAFASDDFVVFAFAYAAEGVVFAEGVGTVAVPGEYSSKIGVIGEDDAEHVVGFAFHPFSAGPNGGDAFDLQSGIAFFDDLFVAMIDAGGGVL